MTTHVYREVRNEVLNQAQKLTPDEQLLLLEELIAFMRQKGQVPVRRKHDITELRGLGKEIWEGVDVAKYINEERDSWNR